ncbi:hypothetical protein [Mycobacterium palustre]|uniref:hypothetical protein n=1 Tax=Mycobacterium palustre TaxID=153971 RepID=UPI001152E414|nr:hypothetical protein [Mycobacterium palustre]MCV7103206.1 hypothetical protein [Mycobacterium palustre]
MAGDLPAGKYSAVLVGAWWPQPSSALRAGVQRWNMQQQLQEPHAQDLHRQWIQLAAANTGYTADDLVLRFHKSGKQHVDLVEKYQAPVGLSS